MKINNINGSYKTYNTNIRKNANSNNLPSFKGGHTNIALNKLSDFYTNVANTKLFQKFL